MGPVTTVMRQHSGVLVGLGPHTPVSAFVPSSAAFSVIRDMAHMAELYEGLY